MRPLESWSSGAVSSTTRRFVAALLLICAGVGGLWLLHPDPVLSQSREADPSPEVIQAIRLLLSGDPKEETRGENTLKRLGQKAIPQLRQWVRRVQHEVDRISAVLSELEGGQRSSLPTERMTACDFFSKKTVECRTLIRKGDYRKVLDIANAILVLDPRGPFSWELRRMASRAKGHVVSRQTIEPMLEVGSLVYEVGQKPEVVFRVVNHDSRVARIRVERGILGELDVVVTRRFIDGSLKRDERKLPIKVPEDVDQIVIGPGQSWDYALDLGVDEKPHGLCVTRVKAAGRFRPTRWTVERQEENISLPMNAAEFWVVPPGQDFLCDRPVEKLTTALFFGKVEPLFVAGQICVWAGEEDPYLNEQLVEVIVGSLDDLDPTRSRLAIQFLVDATGQQLGDDGERWKAWWSKLKAERKQGAPAGGGDAAKEKGKS